MEQLKKIDNIIKKIEIFIVTAGLILLIATVFLAAVLRFFNVDMSVSTDLAQLIFSWISFVGASMAMRNSSHMGLDFVREKFSLKVQYIIKIICDVLIIMFLIFVLIYGINLSIVNAARKYNTLYISYSFATISCPVGACLMLISAIKNIVNDIKSFMNLKKVEVA